MPEGRVRIISGTHKGRHISAPKGWRGRPTTDFAKESLFNILLNYVEFSEIKALDLFAGTGSLSFELASRGCRAITCVDNDYHAFSFIKEKNKEFDFGINVIRSDAFSFINACGQSFDLVIVDPPFDLDKLPLIPGMIFEKGLIKQGGMLVVEHGRDTDFSTHTFFNNKRTYGNVNFSFFNYPDTENQ